MFYGWEQVTKEQVLNLLLSLRDLFQDESRWINWPLAANALGQEVIPTDPHATAWCLPGATEKLVTEMYLYPLSTFIDCAGREFLNDLSEELLIKGTMDYRQEFALICQGIEELNKDG